MAMHSWYIPSNFESWHSSRLGKTNQYRKSNDFWIYLNWTCSMKDNHYFFLFMLHIKQWQLGQNNIKHHNYHCIIVSTIGPHAEPGGLRYTLHSWHVCFLVEKKLSYWTRGLYLWQEEVSEESRRIVAGLVSYSLALMSLHISCMVLTSSHPMNCASSLLWVAT